MSRTINRQPLSVDTNIDTDVQYFNHYNWKGLYTGKNYLNLDQETFEDCKNIYIDENGILKSRPSFKLIEYNNANILNIWNYLGITVILYRTEILLKEVYVLRFVDYDIAEFVSKYVKLFVFDGKIIFLTGDKIKYFEDGKLYNCDNIIYKPIKYLITNNVKEEYESDNVLTKAYRERYIYTGIDSIVNAPYIGRTVTIKYNDYSETTVFDEYSKNTIFLPKYSVANSELLQVSSIDNVISCKKLEDGGYDIYYSPNGKIFTLLTTVYELYGEPVISKDGRFVVVFKNDGPYALSLLEDNLTGVKTFTEWTNLLTYNNIDKSTFVELGNYVTGFHNCVGGTFINENTFAYAYGIQYNNSVDGLTFNKIQYVKVNKDANSSNSVSFSYYDSSKGSTVTDTAKNQKIYTDYDGDKIYFASKLNSKGVSLNIDNDTDKSSVFVYCNDIYDLKVVSKEMLINDSYGYMLLGNFTDADYNATFVYYKTKTRNYYKEIPGDFGKILNNYNIITNKSYYNYDDNSIIDFTDRNITNVVKSYGHSYYISEGLVYGNYIGDDLVTVDVEYEGAITNFTYDHYCKLNEHYFAKDNTLYISSYRTNDDGKQMLYVPDLNTQKFDEKITNIHPISETQIGIFFKDEIWHSDLTEDGKYLYYKSKLQTGCLEGSDVITSIDGKNIIFSSTRGLVYMSYQELVQSTEQTLTYLSDSILQFYEEFNKKPVKLYLYKFWLYCYHTDEKVFYIFDLRNNSWWKWEYSNPILNIILIDDKLQLITNAKNGVRILDKSAKNYFDEEGQIDWYFISQKMHLGTLNYSKNVDSITINNVETEDIGEDVSFNLQITNYRNNVSNRYLEPKTINYKVNMLRSFVKRCNSRKVNEFQYIISSDTGDNSNAIQLPLSIHSIIIKYTISNQVR